MSTRAELGALEAGGLIQIAALHPELEYLFRHALVQEAAYATLLKQDRRSLHKAAAETILALHPDRERELAAVIGMHYEQAGEAERAAHYLVIAGDHAVERFANKEAVGFFIRANTLADGDLRLRAAVGAAKAGWSITGIASNIERLEQAASTAEPSSRGLAAEAYAWIAFLRRQRGETPETSPALKEALERGEEIGEALNDPRAAALPKALIGSFAAMTGHLREGVREMRDALDAIVASGDPLSIAMVSDFLAMTYARLGEFPAAEEALELAAGQSLSGDAISMVDVDIARSAVLLERGEVESAAMKAAGCAARAEKLGAYACVVASSLTQGAAEFFRDDAGGARTPLERADELSMVTNMAPMRNVIKGLLGSVRTQLGDLPRGAADWEGALANTRAMNDRYGEAQTLWARARALVRRPAPDWSEALTDLDRGVELFESMEARPSLARALRDRADVFRNLGRVEQAAEDERRSRELAKQLDLKDLPFTEAQ